MTGVGQALLYINWLTLCVHRVFNSASLNYSCLVHFILYIFILELVSTVFVGLNPA